GIVIIACAATMCAPRSRAQALPRPAQATRAGRAANRAPDYLVRPPAPPEQAAHGQQVFQSNCGFCHGSDARGGETGPNLVRAQLVLTDQHGELITPIVQNGIPAQGMPKFALGAADIEAISAFVVALRGRDGTYRSFARHDSIPKVVVTNPLQWHIDMLPQWRDADIHNLTAYVVTLK